MKKSFFFLSLLVSVTGFGQYYYKDLMDAAANNEKMRTYLANKVASVTATGYDPRGVKTTDFYELHEVFPAQNMIRISTRNGQSVVRTYYRYDEQGRISSITDSTNGITNRTSYQYAGNNIISIKTVSNDSLNGYNTTEEHAWIYNNAGKPEKMWKIVNGKDSAEYRFTTDEKGNVADETLFRRGVGADPFYFYYDEENRLTDIARYNSRAKKILPDFMFEYDEQDRMIQKITTLSTVRPDYLTWRYVYNDKGLKTKEALFNKQKELTGRIDYSYSFQQ